jgi:hypothetical protein
MVEEAMVRLRLSVGDSTVSLPGFVQIDPLNQNRPGNPADLTKYAEEGEAVEIVAADVLDYYPCEFRSKLLGHWVSRLSRGGMIIIGTREIVEVCRYVMLGEAASFDKLVFGPVGGQRRQSAGTLPELKSMLSLMGTTLVRSYVKDFMSYVEAIRD